MNPLLPQEPCLECGQVHEWCSGHKKRSDPKVPCLARPKAGHRACRVHGGATPQADAKAERAAREVEARRAIDRLLIRRDIDPATALLEEVQRCAGAVAYIEDRIRELDPDGLVWGATQRKQGSTGQGYADFTVEGPGLSEWVRWWHVERERLVKASAAAIAADVDTRIVRLAEQQGAMLADVIAGVLDDLGLSAAQRALVPSVVPRRLRLVAG